MFSNNLINELVIDKSGLDDLNEICLKSFQQAFIHAMEEHKPVLNVAKNYYTQDIWQSREFTELLEYLDGNGFIIHYRTTGTLIEINLEQVCVKMLELLRDDVPFKMPNI